MWYQLVTCYLFPYSPIIDALIILFLQVHFQLNFEIPFLIPYCHGYLIIFLVSIDFFSLVHMALHRTLIKDSINSYWEYIIWHILLTIMHKFSFNVAQKPPCNIGWNFPQNLIYVFYIFVKVVIFHILGIMFNIKF